MKSHLDIVHEGTLGDADRVRMTLDENSLSHLMGVLTDLYTNPGLAAIREYSTNAYDAHLAAGNPDPIEVVLPTHLNPIFVVRDHGTGMSVQELTDNFSKYGWSSKRDNDLEVGMLGLGCKSALTFTSQFTIVSVKDALKAVVLVTRDADGCGALQIIDTCGTDEPNGVEVQIPVVGSVGEFNYHARDFFRFWQPGTVNVIGDKIVPLGEGENEIVLDPDVILFADTASQSYLVMGNVPYPLPYEECERLRKAFGGLDVAVRVPVGAIDFAPSREALQMTKRTKQVIEEAADFVLNVFPKVAQRYVDKCTTHGDALVTLSKWTGGRRHLQCYFRGEMVPTKFFFNKRKHFVWYVTEKLDEMAAGVASLEVEQALSDETLHVVNKPAGLRTCDKRRLRKYIETLDPKPRWVYTHATGVEVLPWLEGVAHVVDYKVIQAIDLDGPTKVVAGNWTAWDRHGSWVRVAAFSPSDDLFYVTGGETYRNYNVEKWEFHSQHLQALPEGACLVRIPDKRLPKFLATYPHARSYTKWVATEYAAIEASKTPLQWWCEMSYHNVIQRKHFESLARSASEINDPTFVKFVCDAVAVGLPNPHDAHRSNLRAAANFFRGVVLARHGSEDNEYAAEWARINGEYPVLAGFGGDYLTLRQKIEYLNAMYLYNQSKTSPALPDKKEASTTTC